MFFKIFKKRNIRNQREQPYAARRHQQQDKRLMLDTVQTACYKRKRKQGKTVDIRADYGEIFKMLCATIRDLHRCLRTVVFANGSFIIHIDTSRKNDVEDD